MRLYEIRRKKKEARKGSRASHKEGMHDAGEGIGALLGESRQVEEGNLSLAIETIRMPF